MKDGILLQSVSFAYYQGKKQLDSISTHIPRGTFCGVTGVNGSGKTTFTYLVNGLIPHEISGKLTGAVWIDGDDTQKKSLSFFSQKVGMVFQNPDFMLFNLTVEEEIAFGLKNFNKTSHEKRIADSLKLVGLSGFEKRDPQTLSLGEKQKVALACILALDTPYIIMDEPVAMLDYQGALQLYKTLDTLHKKFGKTIIVVEHDTDFLFAHTQQTIVLDKGKILFDGPTKEVFQHKRVLREIGIKMPQPIA